MDLVISIVSWNTRELIEKCLLSLRRFTRPDHARVVVIDNASRDGTPEMVRTRFPEVTLIESGGNLGFGRGHNLIAKYSTEPFILFLNPDTEFVEPAHEKMLDAFHENPRTGAVGCMLVDSDGTVNQLGLQWYPSPVTELFSHLFLSTFALQRAKRFLPWQDPQCSGFIRKMYGGCLMVRREVLDRVGWFDERFFMYGEDVDLSRRITAGGFQIYYLSTSKVIHTGGGASSKAPGRFAVLMQCESIAKFMQKYHGPLGRSVYSGGVFLRALSRLVILGLVRFPVRIAAPARFPAIENSHAKQLAMLKWSVGLLRPSIPK